MPAPVKQEVVADDPAIVSVSEIKTICSDKFVFLFNDHATPEINVNVVYKYTYYVSTVAEVSFFRNVYKNSQLLEWHVH